MQHLNPAFTTPCLNISLEFTPCGRIPNPGILHARGVSWLEFCQENNSGNTSVTPENTVPLRRQRDFGDERRNCGPLDLLSHKEDMGVLLDFVYYSLPGYTALTALTVCPWHLERVMEHLRCLKHQGRAPVDLETVYTIVSDNEGILLDCSTAAKVVIVERLAGEYLYRSYSLSGSLIYYIENIHW